MQGSSENNGATLTKSVTSANTPNLSISNADEANKAQDPALSNSDAQKAKVNNEVGVQTRSVTSETIIIEGNPPKVAQPISQKPDNKRDYSKCITLKTALENYKAKLSDPNSNNKNTGYFLDTKDKEAKAFIEKAHKTIGGCIENGAIDGSVEIRGRRANAFTLRFSLKDDKGSFSADKFFDSEFYKNSEPKITAVTLYTTKEQLRGIRISKEEGKSKLYEIINGSYNIVFKWEIGARVCSITMNINSDGTVTYIDSKNCSRADLVKNTAVNITIGEDQSEKWTLAELVSKAHNLEQDVQNIQDIVKSAETVTADPQSSFIDLSAANAKDLSQHDRLKQASAAKGPGK